MSIDYDKLNEESTKLYRVAFEEGRRQGDQEGASRISEDRLRGGIELAVRMLESSVAARDQFDQRERADRRGDDWSERVLAMYARRMLGRVPAAPDVMRGIELLSKANLNNAPGGIKRKSVDDALKHLTSYLDALGGYR